MGHVKKVNSFCMLRQTIQPLRLSLDQCNETTSAIDSRGDYPAMNSGRSSMRKNQFSFPMLKLENGILECDDSNAQNSEVRSTDSSNQWIKSSDGLHKHMANVYTSIPTFGIISGAFSIGKSEFNNEDAYFVSERSFGVADGVSGWADFGFSSSEFSNQLMRNCKIQIEQFDIQKKQKA